MEHIYTTEVKKTDALRILTWIMIVSAVVRMAIAAMIQLGNDEVYYHLYASYLSLSYFDHPAMVSWVQWLTTCGLSVDDEFTLRLSSVIFGTINTYVIYRVGCEVKNAVVGLYAALLYTASLYATVICGIFIMPDGALSTFYLLSVWMMVGIFATKGITEAKKKKMVFLGVFMGLAVLSKYHAVYLCAVALAMVVFWERKWLRMRQFYAAVSLFAVAVSPIIVWNVQNQWASFAFHGARVAVSDVSVDFGAIFRELFGGMGYNNPVCWVLILVSLVAVWKKVWIFTPRVQKILIWLGLPVILIFMVISVFRDTLPHWSGMGYLSLTVLSAGYLYTLTAQRAMRWIKTAICLLVFVLFLAVAQIKTGAIPLGTADPTLDMYGWDTLKEKTDSLLSSDENKDIKTMVTYRWFPAGHMDYYVARPLGLKMLAAGPLDRIHEYVRIDSARGGARDEKVLYLVDENDFMCPEEAFPDMFTTVKEYDKIKIYRMGKIAKQYRVYVLYGFTLKNENYD
ncbi:MAG: glycosyltransferase family 39 protein [Flavobacteriales bacterium]|nr:glycosyltransferase family 39 protein [Flavobacteriales bacterium]